MQTVPLRDKLLLLPSSLFPTAVLKSQAGPCLVFLFLSVCLFLLYPPTQFISVKLPRKLCLRGLSALHPLCALTGHMAPWPTKVPLPLSLSFQGCLIGVSFSNVSRFWTWVYITWKFFPTKPELSNYLMQSYYFLLQNPPSFCIVFLYEVENASTNIYLIW